MTRILLVENQALICEVLKTSLEVEQDFQIVGQVNNGEAAIQQAEILQPDIILMDIDLPEMDGLTATQIICDRCPFTSIIILSIYEDAASLSLALQAGAQGYLLKNSQAKHLINAIRFIGQGNHQLAPQLKLLKQITWSMSPLNQAPSHPLTPKMTRAAESYIDRPFRDEKSKDTSLSVSVVEKDNPKNVSSLIWAPIIIVTLGSLLLFSNKLSSYRFSRFASAVDQELKDERKSEFLLLDENNALTVETVNVKPVKSYQEARFYTGSIKASRTSELGFSNLGQVIRITVQEGDRVLKGQPLAYQDNRELEAEQQELLAQRSQLISQLKEMQAGPRNETIAVARATTRDLRQQLKLALTKYQRREALYQQGAISREQLDETKSNQLVLQARLDKTKSRLDELLAGTRPEQIEGQKSALKQIEAKLTRLKIKQEKNILKAPFAAIISRRLVDEGTVVDRNQPILRLVENQALEAHIGIPLATANQISLGSSQQLQIGAKKYTAKVSAVLPELDVDTRTLTVVLTLDESLSNQIFLGQTAKLELLAQIPTSGYWLPTTALIEGGRGLWFCYVLGQKVITKSHHPKTFYVERRDVEILYTQSSNRVLVRGTLHEGDRVILSGTHRIVPGQIVRPVEN